MTQPSRSDIIQSHRLMRKILNAHNINSLVYLFNINNKNEEHNIAKYIEDERNHMKLSSTNVRIKYYVKGFNTNKSMLIISIIKNKKEFVHLTIHLSLHTLHDNSMGMIHFSKDIYPEKMYTNRNTGIIGNNPNHPYAPIYVKYPTLSKSLIFSVPERYYTTVEVKNPKYDAELRQEIDVILTVLNRLFDEHNKKFYIGNNMSNGFDPEKNYLPFNKNKIDKILMNVNKHRKIMTRTNRGIMMYPSFTHNNKIEMPIRRRTLKSKRINNSHSILLNNDPYLVKPNNIELHDEIQYIPIQINRRRETIKPHKRVL